MKRFFMYSGSWNAYDTDNRSSRRIQFGGDFKFNIIGFRIIKTII